MTSAVQSLTPHLSLRKLKFNFPNWGDDANANQDIIDAAFGALGFNNIVGIWQNSLDYIAGDMLIDDTDLTVWRCLIGHTSAASGTFAADRLLHPTYWTQFVITNEPGFNLTRKSTRDYPGATLRDRVNAFIADANANGGNMELHFDHIDGTSFDLSAGPLDAITGRNTWFDGHGRLLIMNKTGYTFLFGNGTNFCFGGGVKNFEFYYSTDGTGVTAAGIAISCNYVSFATFKNIVMTGGAGIYNGTCTGGHTNIGIKIDMITGAVDDIANSAFVERGHSVALSVSNTQIANRYDSGGNICATERNCIVDSTSTAGSYSSLILDSVVIERFYKGISVAAAAGVFKIDYFFQNIVVDGCYKQACYFLSSGSGILSNIEMVNCWYNAVVSSVVSTYGAYFQSVGTGRVGLLDMSKCFCTGGKTADLALVGRICDVNITGLRAYSYEAGMDAAKCGVLLDNADGVMQNISITGSQIEVDTLLTSFDAAYGIYINGNTTIPGLMICNNVIGGTTTQLLLGTHTVNNTKHLVANNRYVGSGTRPGGFKTTGVHVIALTTVDWVHYQPHRLQIYIYGGTVTDVSIRDVGNTKNTVKAGSDINFILEPGEMFSITYTVAPTVRFKVLE